MRRDGAMVSQAKPQMPKLPHRQLTVLTREQIRAMEDATPAERDRLIIRLLADTGLRLSELLGLTTSDLIEQGRDRFIKVHGKGARDRMVPLQPALFVRLRRYIDRQRPEEARSDRVFLALRHSRVTGEYEPLGPRAVQELTLVAARSVGITDRPVNPHAFRHAFATNCLRRGMNPIQLQNILGHSTLEMIVGVYSHLAPNDAADALMRVLRSDD